MSIRRREVERWKKRRRDTPSSSSICILSPRSSFPTNRNPPGASSFSTYVGSTSYRCRCRSHATSLLPYSRRSLLPSVLGSKIVGRRPSRIVPPKCVFEISGMKQMTGCGESGTSSAEFAPALPQLI